MPLVIFSGFPSSGKTTRANQLKEHLLSKKATLLSKLSFPWDVVILNDESLNINKSDYDNANDEKRARGKLIGAVERSLNKQDVVVVDGLNYIKGFRYQLYCIARAIGTTHCVVHCTTGSQVVREWNQSRAPESRYKEETLESLIQRFEEPGYFNRWDTPMFVIQPTDENLPFDQISSALFDKEVPPPNLSTIVKPARDEVFSIDQVTNQITKAIMQSRKENPFLSEIKLQDCPIPIRIGMQKVSIHQLKRHAHQFTKLINQVTSTTSSPDLVKKSFIEYLNQQWST